jgi:hypothetical protein
MHRSGLAASLFALAVTGCSKPAEVELKSWSPGTIYRTPTAANDRGLVDRRGLIHAHSYYSHDACDGAPRNENGNYDQTCFDDFRRGLCEVGHDFVFLTDHRESFDENEFPDVLLYREDLGDTLVDHGEGPSANRLSCPSGPAPLVMAGAETTPMMPVGLERHAGTRSTRGDIYGADGADALLEVKKAGAVALVAHTERWTVDELTTLPLDGFEMFNLHANTFKNLSTVADLVFTRIEKGDFEGLPHPDTFLLYFQLEDPAYLETWGTVFARGAHRVTTMGTDCHRNSLPQPMSDGERVDSYRRMMAGFSNHLLVKPQADGTFDDRDLKDALRQGRLYGAFEFLGYPAGFEFTGTDARGVVEMGGEVSVASKAKLTVSMPRVLLLDKNADAPALTAKVLKAKEGGWDVVAQGSDSLEFMPTEPGAYRTEIRMVPSHLKSFAGKRVDLIKTERPWVLSNVIYVTP